MKLETDRIKNLFLNKIINFARLNVIINVILWFQIKIGK